MVGKYTLIGDTGRPNKTVKLVFLMGDVGKM